MDIRHYWMPPGPIRYNIEFERRLAAMEMGFKTRAEFEVLDIEEQAEVVAIWKLRRLISAADSWYNARKQVARK